MSDVDLLQNLVSISYHHFELTLYFDPSTEKKKIFHK